MSVPLFHTLNAMDELVREQDVPHTRHDAAELHDMVHRVSGSLDALHDDLAECLGPLNRCGRCDDCGRLVAPGMWRVHEKGPGCLYVVPLLGTAVWLVHHREGIPVVGNLIWRYRRRKSAPPTKDAHIPPSDLPPSGGGM